MPASVWKGRITFGLVAVPVRLVKAARRERTRFRRVHRLVPPPEPAEEKPPKLLAFPSSGRTPPAPEPEPAADEDRVVRVRNAALDPLTEEPVAPSKLLKGYEVAKDEFVVLQPEEVTALRPRTSTELQIAEFVKVIEIDPVYYETSYWVVPEPGGERPYALLHAALRDTGTAGLGSLAMHGREHIVALRPGRDALIAHVMFYQNEVGRPAYQVEGNAATAKELELARMLVTALEAPFEPDKWTDRYEERLKALIESRPATAGAGAEPTPRAMTSPEDLMEKLRKSLQMSRKPVTSEQRANKAKRTPARRK